MTITLFILIENDTVHSQTTRQRGSVYVTLTQDHSNSAKRHLPWRDPLCSISCWDAAAGPSPAVGKVLLGSDHEPSGGWGPGTKPPPMCPDGPLKRPPQNLCYHRPRLRPSAEAQRPPPSGSVLERLEVWGSPHSINSTVCSPGIKVVKMLLKTLTNHCSFPRFLEMCSFKGVHLAHLNQKQRQGANPSQKLMGPQASQAEQRDLTRVLFSGPS